MQIRPAIEQDHVALSLIMRQSITSGCREAYGAAIVDAWTHKDNTVFNFSIPERTFVGESDGSLVGFCSWVQQADDAAISNPCDKPVIPATGYARINRMFLLPDVFGTGLGRKLLDATEGAARAEGFRRFVLWSSLNALSFYQAAGYQESGEELVPVTKKHKIPVIKMVRKD